MELLDDEPVQFFRRTELLLNQVLIIRDANLSGRQTVKACGKHFAQNLIELSARSVAR